MSILGDAIIAGVASTGPKPELNKNKWSVINEVALAGTGPNYWSVGDTKEVTLNGSVGYGSSQATFSNTKYWVYILGFDHNSSKEGTGIAFQGFKTAQSGGVDIAMCWAYNSSSTGSIMNAFNTNSGGWAGSVAYKTIMPQWKSCFPSELQDVIKSTTLYTDNTGGGSTSASAVTANSNEVYYLAEYEVFGARSYANTNEQAQQQQYAYYKAGNSKIKYRSDGTSNAAFWWFRSPFSGNSYNFCSVSDTGAADYSSAHYSCGAAPAFKVGNPPPLTGEWVFNASPEIVGQDDLSGIQLFQFTSNNENYSYIDFTTDSSSSASIKYGDNTIAYKLSGWTNTAYRTINITTPFYRNTNPTFYDWFVANAVQGGVIPEIPLSGDLAVGKIVTYDNKPWRVVHNDGTKWYLAAKDAITTTAFGSNTTYAGSTIYNIVTNYLNGMTAVAKKFMVNVTVEGVTSKAFLPTYDQVNGGFSYYNSDANRLLAYGGDAVAWWLSSKYGDTYVRDVRSDGTIGAWEPNNVLGCRPHICIDTSITGEFNGIKAGNYAFNMTIPEMPADQAVSFKSYGITCTQMINTGGVLRYVGGMSQNAYTYSSNTWSTPQCRKLEVLKDHEVSSDITQAYYDWFNTNANACKVLPAGSYKFDDTLTDYSGIYEYLSMDYLSSGGTYTAITAIRYSGGYLQFLIGSTWSNMYSPHWIHTNYKNVRVNTDQYVSPDFYNWFMANATKQ